MNWSLLLRKSVPSRILKKKPVKKVRTITYKDMLVDQELGEEVKPIQQAFLDWKNDCKGIGSKAMGITGRGHKKDASPDGGVNLYDQVERHVIPEVQRPGQGSRKGVKQRALIDMDKIITDTTSLLTVEDEKKVSKFIKDLVKMSTGDSNPCNIPFTQVPVQLRKKDGKWVVADRKDYYGHYRTPGYVEARKEIDKSKNELSPVDSSWYSDTKNSAKPPLWQAIFSGAKDIEGPTGSGNLMKEGLLKILQDYQKALDGAYIPMVIFNDVGDIAGKVEAISNIPKVQSELLKFMKERDTYRGGTSEAYVSYGGATGILTKMNGLTFSGEEGKGYLDSISDHLDEIVGGDNVKQFKIKFTKAVINRLINQTVRDKLLIPPHLKDKGKPFILSSEGKGRKTEGYSWTADYNRAIEESKVKKSWIDSLWG